MITPYNSKEPEMSIDSFASARSAVTRGTAPAAAARELVSHMTAEERLWCLDGDAPTLAGAEFLTTADGYHRAPFLAAQVPRVGMPGIAFSDGPRGAVIGDATCFPVTMARGATWDPGLEERVGDAIGRELRATGANLTGAVCVNLLRHPAWGRAQETYGEDPHHVGEMGAAFTRGLQGHVMACVKHFACNSMENARFRVDIEVDEIALHEIYLAHFKRIVDEGVASVMSAYNSVNGEWCGENRPLLTDVLRDEWGFEGFVISDFVFGVHDASASVRAGLDIEMPFRMARAQHLPGALERGGVTWADIDRTVERVVATLLRFDAILSAPMSGSDTVGKAAHRELAREVAARSIVLLRNEPVEGCPVLPLSDVHSLRLAVFGRLADTENLGDHGSSDVWDLNCDTVLDGLRDTSADVVYDEGNDPAHVAVVAGAADAALVVVGYTSLDEGEFMGEMTEAMLANFPPADEPEVAQRYANLLAGVPEVTKPARVKGVPGGFSIGGDRISLRLSPRDVELIRAVSAANPRTVVAIEAGSAVVMTEWIESVPAVVQCWYGGGQAGPGLADVLFGDVNPSARLPFSVPVRETDLPAFDRDATHVRYDRWHGWWHLENSGRTPAFPFGFGLSYTTFALRDIAIGAEGAHLVVRGSVTNTGARDGADVVQVYAELPDPDRPKRLVGFARVEVAAGGIAALEIAVPLERLATRDDRSHAWKPPSGQYTLSVGHRAGNCDGGTFVVDVPSTSRAG
jgi:beta-glucosidase